MYFVGIIVLFLFVVYFVASELRKHDDIPTGIPHFFEDCPHGGGCVDCIDPFED